MNRPRLVDVIYWCYVKDGVPEKVHAEAIHEDFKILFTYIFELEKQVSEQSGSGNIE